MEMMKIMLLYENKNDQGEQHCFILLCSIRNIENRDIHLKLYNKRKTGGQKSPGMK